MGTASLDIVVNPISPSPMPLPQRLPPPPQKAEKVVVKRDADRTEESQNVIAKDENDRVARLAEDIKTVVESLNINISFSIERDLNPDLVIAKVIDKDTGDVIRQIPSEEIVELAKRLDEFVGIVFNKKT